MGIYLALQNHDDLFNRSTVQPIIINDISAVTDAENDAVNRLISTRYTGDLMSNEPSCDCGYTKDGYNLGTVCSNCKGVVKEIFDQDLQSLVWMRSPHGVEKLLNPMIILQLSKRFIRKGFNLIEWLCNTDYHPAAAKPPEVDELLQQGLVRGYNNFITNFDSYLEVLFKLKTSKKEETDSLMENIRQNRECVMSWHIPLPNKSLLVIENTEVGTFVDPIIIGAVDAIRTICSIDTPLSNYTLRQKENKTAKTLFILAKFNYEVYHDILASKNGLFRKHIFGSRNYFSTRAVISSNTKTHEYDEIHIPWAAGITMFKPHLMNKLMRLDYTPSEGSELLQKSIYTYNELIDNLFKELISETRDKCFYCIYGRNLI